MTGKQVASCAVDVTQPGFRLDPHGGYERLRRGGPVCWQPAARSYVVSHCAEATEALRNPLLGPVDLAAGWRKIGARLGRDYHAAVHLLEQAPFLYEGERHRRLRTIVARAVAPFTEALRPFEIRAEALLAKARRDGGFDLVKDYAGELLFEVVCDLMELPDGERGGLRPLCHASAIIEPTLSVRERDEVARHLASGLALLEAHIRRVLARPGPSLVHALKSAMPSDEPDAVSAVAYFAILMLAMGNDAIAGCIAFPVRHLIERDAPAGSAPAQSDWGRISDDAIRFAAPVDLLSRTATADTAVGRCPVLRGERLLVSPAAANRDRLAVGADAASIRPRPEIGPGLSFGAGRHLCVGARLSRNLVHVAFAQLAALPRLEADGPAQHGSGQAIRTLTSLPVRLT